MPHKRETPRMDGNSSPEQTRPPLQFSLRQLLLAMAGFSVIFAGIAAFGLVEVLEVIMFLFAVALWYAMIRFDGRRPTRMPITTVAAFHVVLVTVLLVVSIGLNGFFAFDNAPVRWVEYVAAVPMFPLSLLHHGICRAQSWHSGLAQPGTFFLIATLNALLWIRAYQKIKRRFTKPVTEK